MPRIWNIGAGVAYTARAFDVEIRRDGGKLEHVVDAAQLERFAFEAHHRDRRLLKVQLAPFGGDDDLFELLRLRRAKGAERSADSESKRADWKGRSITTRLHTTPKV